MHTYIYIEAKYETACAAYLSMARQSDTNHVLFSHLPPSAAAAELHALFSEIQTGSRLAAPPFITRWAFTGTTVLMMLSCDLLLFW